MTVSPRRMIPCAIVSALFGTLLSACASDPMPAPPRDDEVSRVDRAFGSAPSEREAVRATPIVLSQEEWSFGGRDGFIIRTPHYRLFTTESDQVLRERMPLFLEHAIAHYRSAITDLPLPSQKLDTYLMDNRPQWDTLTKRLLGEQSEGLGQIQRGGYASRGLGVYFDIGLYDTLAIAAHEGWHQYTQRTFRDPLPVWLEEGLATYMEGHAWRGGVPVFRSWQNTERFDMLRALSDSGRLISLEALMSERPTELLDGDPQGVLRYYAQVWALTHFFKYAENGAYADSLGQLLQDAVDGTMSARLVNTVGQREASIAIGSRTGNAVARTYFSNDALGLDGAYQRFIADLTRQGARDAIVAGRSPLDAGR